MFRFNRNALKLFIRSPEQVIPYLQSQFYSVKRRELEAEKQELNRKLERYAFDAKMDEITQKSLRLFRAELATRYHWRNNRRFFEKNDFRRNSAEFTREYPVVLSTTYSIKGTLSIEHIYDYLIVDEASQVDLVTGVLAFSCARNIVIVGDLKQLPNVLTENDIRTSDAIWQKYSLDERYRFSTHSLLSSALEIWQDAPVTLLREHYRCHPKIINFCNQKFYNRQLIVMTKDHDEPNVLAMYRTTAGNHARGHLNQRQIDVIQQEVLPRLHQQNFQSIGIITPYFDLYTKGGKLRRLYIPKKLRTETIEWLEETNRSSGYLFLNRYGERITTRGISQQLKNYADKYGLDKKVVYPHSFRHRYAKNFLEKYNDIALLADLMGHESIETTRIYLRRTASEQQALVDKIVTW